MDEALRFVHHSVVNELPELLSLSAKALRKAPFKATVREWREATIDDALALAPFAGFAFVLGSLLLSATQGPTSSTTSTTTPATSARTVASNKESYWLTRIVLLRGMGLIYLAAFLTSAAQSRALFGTLGLSW